MADSRSADVSLRILVVDDEESIRLTLGMCLEDDGHVVVSCATIEAAMEYAARQVFDLVFLDVRLGVHNGLDYIPGLRADRPWMRIVVITAYASVATAVKAMKLGATDYLPKPFTPALVQMVTHKVAERRRLDMRVEALQTALGSMDPETDLATENVEMRRALDLARQAADSGAAILICGETGTGKGRLARAIHAWSRRSAGPIETVCCDTASADLLSAELFGAVGVESSGSGETPGRIDFCAGGTLVLEEAARTPPSLQPKLLRLLSEKEYERHADFKPRSADIRPVATSGVHPEEAVRRGRLRPELLLAMDVVRVRIPPLRERPEDIRMLARRYLAYFGRENHRAIGGLTQQAMAALRRYPWPGNNRELRNLIERAVILCRGEEIGLEHFPPDSLNTAERTAVGDLVPLDAIEDLHIQRVLDSTGSIKGAAAVLGIGVSTMVRWMKRARVRTPRRSPDPPGVSPAAARNDPSPDLSVDAK